MKRFLLFAICCIGISASAQDLTGIWRGGFRSMAKNRLMEMLGQDDRYKFEVQLDQKEKAFAGVTYSYLTTVFYGKATCQGTVNPKTGKVLLDELKIVEQRMSSGGGICLMTLFLQYSKVGDEEFLEGTYTSMKLSDSTDCGKGTVFLRKVVTSDFYKEPFLVEREKEADKKPLVAAPKPDSAVAKKVTPAPDKPAVTKKVTTPPTSTAKTKTTPVTKPVTKPPATSKTNTIVKKADPPKTPPVAKVTEPNLTTKPIIVDTVKKVEKPVVAAPTVPTPKILVTRENELVKTIVTSANEIYIRIYDNGSVDNDTISVYLDKKLVLSKQRLTEKAIPLKIKLDDDNTYHELVMVAENLGEVPPNTSLMVVEAGKQTFEVRITSTEQKNAVVIFKYDAGSKK
jgi:hypothetical protein